MHIRGQKRTAKIDSEREKLLGYTSDGQPVHTTQGMFTPTQDQKHELSHALAAKRLFEAVQVVKNKVIEAGAGFAMSVVLKTAPDNVVRSHNSDNQQLFLDWFVNNGFAIQQDGFTTVVLCRGTELARTTAKVPEWLHLEVLAALKAEQIIAKHATN